MPPPRAKLLVTLFPSHVGTMPHDPELSIPMAVWVHMGPHAQAVASRAGELRRHLRGVAALGFLSRHLQSAAPDAPLAPLSVADARAGGISVLSESEDILEAGFFDVPPLDTSVAAPPKSFSFASVSRILILPQRLLLSFEFVRAVTGRSHNTGTPRTSKKVK